MQLDASIRKRKKRSCLTYLPVAVLAVASLVALWQRRRARNSVEELHPPEKVELSTPVPPVTIILPVRNEAAHIEGCLASLTAQDYLNFSIIVIDDGSTDTTPQQLAAWSARDSRVQVHRVDQFPPGWAGKTHALHLGAMLARSEWLLFTDADTRHERQTLSLMMGHALQHQDDLLSMGMNLMTLSGPVMPLLMPITEILLAQRLTPATILDATSKRSFAFGQYILLRKEAYLWAGGYNMPGMRTCTVEDMALAEQIKQSGRLVEIVDGRGLLRNRQWTTWKSARQGWGKSCYSEFIRSHIPFGGFPAALALIAYGLGPAWTCLYLGSRGKIRRASFWLAFLTLLAQIDAKRHVDRKYGLSQLRAFTAPFAWIVCGIMALDVTRQILTGQPAAWKGRQLPRQEPAEAIKSEPAPFVLPLGVPEPCQAHLSRATSLANEWRGRNTRHHQQKRSRIVVPTEGRESVVTRAASRE